MRALALIVCLVVPVAAAAQEEFWCWDADEITADVCGDTLHLSHYAALLNCCPDPITYVIEAGDATILVEEHSLSVCDCDCCYDVKVAIADVPPGPWQVLYRWFDIEIWDWAERVLEIEVPDVGQGGEPYAARVMDSGCLEASYAPGWPQTPESWGVIKTRYR